MRQNQPVTQREYEFPHDATLMSTTDVKGHVLYANEAFLAVSGFSREEVMGQPHNLVRHPDMPVQAFADMWATLKQGQSWTALVKNRRNNGDHYWVRANATPVVRNQQLIGYMSVRTRPSREEVQAAEALYARFREGRQGSLAFHKGLIVRKGLMRWRSCLQTASLRSRLMAPLLLGWGVTMGGLQLAGPTMPVNLTAGLLLGVVMGTMAFWNERQVLKPLQGVLKQAQSVASGQPEAQASFNRVDEIGMLQRAVNQSGLNLRSLLDDVAAQIHAVKMVSSEIAASNHDLSARTEQTASNLQETAASMEQMTSTVGSTSHTALQASAMAEKASHAAGEGGRIVSDVVTTMGEISTSARRINDIIGVIDGIAFQTNILALNAAVEAARAGEHGRGFAVVAGEVRGLAQRCAVAAREIKGLIADSTERVDVGAALAERAGAAMASILNEAQAVSQMIQDISRSAVEQSTGIGQVNAAVTQLDQMTQQNAALVEQSGAAADGLRQRADRLAEAVDVYR